MAVIGFLNYQDFFDELSNHSISQSIIRVQDYHESHRSTTHPVMMYKFFVVAACQTGAGDTLVCRFKIGWNWDYDKDATDKSENRSKRAAQILKENLATLGWPKICPGIIAASEESKTEAFPDGLWTLKDLDNGPQEKSRP